jgi:hypothetical protein
MITRLTHPRVIHRSSMPNHDTKKATASSAATTSESAVSSSTGNLTSEQGTALDMQESHGNQATLDAFRAQGEETKSAALLNYDVTLGKHLGPQVYQLVKKELSLDKVSKHADLLLQSAIKTAASQINNLDGAIDSSAVDAFGNALALEFEGVGCSLVEGKAADLVTNVRSFALDNPEAVVGIAVLAAAGAYAADLDMPTIGRNFDLNTETSLKLSAKLGTLQNITLEKIEAQLIYEKDNLSISLGASHDVNTDDTKVGFGLTYSW